MGALHNMYRFVEDQQRAKREVYMSAFRALGSSMGMIVLCVLFALLSAGLLWSALPVNNQPTGEWSVVDEKGRIVDVQDVVPYVGMMDDQQIVTVYGNFYGLHLIPARAPRLTEHENFLPAVLCALFAIVFGICAAQFKHGKNEKPSVPEHSAAAAPDVAGADRRADRLAELRRLYDAGILSREEYNERKKKQT